MTGRGRRDVAPVEEWRHPFWPAPSIDRFVVSYPKAGRTWLRVMLAVAEADARSTTTDEVIGEWLRDDAPRLDGRRVLFTHALATSSIDPRGATDLFLRYIGQGRRLFLVRDPRDVVVSHFFHLTRRAGRAHDLASPGEFVRDPARGIDRVLRFMGACDRALREGPGPSILLAYEDLHRDATDALRSALQFFGVPAGEDRILAAVEFGRFEHLQGLERLGALDGGSGRLGARDEDDPESLKIRKGEIGSYADYLGDADCGYLEERIAALQPPALGYLEPGVPPLRQEATRAAAWQPSA